MRDDEVEMWKHLVTDYEMSSYGRVRRGQTVYRPVGDPAVVTLENVRVPVYETVLSLFGPTQARLAVLVSGGRELLLRQHHEAAATLALIDHAGQILAAHPELEEQGVREIQEGEDIGPIVDQERRRLATILRLGLPVDPLTRRSAKDIAATLGHTGP